MIDNIDVQCNYCETKIRLRFQMGYFNIPFDICCPGCGVHVHGVRKIKEGHSTTINNATEIECEINGVDYYADFSVELPHAKTTKYESLEKMIETGFSPFIMTSCLFEGEDYIELLNHMGRFLSFRDFCWPKIKPLFDLFFRKRIELTKKHFLEISPRFVVENELDAMMALHQTMVGGMNAILAKDTLEKFMNVSRKISDPSFLEKLDDLFIALGGDDYFASASKRLVQIYERWMVNFEKYIPAVMISLGNATEKFDKEKFGIATTSFEDMKSFYSDSYELILDFIDVAIGLNNIVVRGDCNAFPVNTVRVNKRTSCVGNFSDYREIVKASRLNLLVNDEPFSKVIPLNRNARNAIAHFNYEFDAGTQKITFRDVYKNKDNTVELYLIELASLCYENMIILVYLDELLYNLRKIQYIKEGMFPHIKVPR